ncbi:MAG: type II secretion system F family protein [Candidatus Aenigmatarchaeota archaeon]
MIDEEKSLFETLCKIFGRIKFPIPKSLEERYKKEIEFLNFKLEPFQIFSTSIVLPILVFVVALTFYIFLNILTIDLILSLTILSLVLFYFLFSYSSFFIKYVRAKASSEMVLSIIYMSISMRIYQNLEKALEFAASNLSGPIGKDLKRALSNLKVGASYSIKEELKKIGEKWKIESQEFNDAISILIETVETSKEELERNIEEAINVVMNGTRRRMKEYALKMKTPLNIINAFGILLPLLVMIFLPVGVIFLPEVLRQATIFTIYLVVLPSIIYMFLLQNFYSRPYSYHQIAINLTKEYKKRKKILLITIPLIVLLTVGFLFTQLVNIEGLTSKFLISLITTNLIGIGIILYYYFLQLKMVTISEKIFKYEEELPTLLYQIGIVAKSGQPIEKVFESVYTSIKSLEITSFLGEVYENLRVRGTSLRDILFNEQYGIIYKYPSKILSSCMKALVDVSEKGVYFASEALKSISSYLDTAKDVNKFTDEVLSEITSEMKITSYIFAPLAGGIIVGLISMLIFIFVNLQPQIEKSLREFEGTQRLEIMRSIEWILNLNKQIPLEYFQLAIGIYIIEVVWMLSWFLGEVTYGDDEIRKSRGIIKMLLISLLIYSGISISIYGITNFILSSALVNMS